MFRTENILVVFKLAFRSQHGVVNMELSTWSCQHSIGLNMELSTFSTWSCQHSQHGVVNIL